LTTIYFSDYTKDGNKIIIPEYYTGETIHWLDFKNYDKFTAPLTITLLDNDNRFIYTDRKTGIEYGLPYPSAVQ
jgi:hypothetical protein